MPEMLLVWHHYTTFWIGMVTAIPTILLPVPLQNVVKMCMWH